MLSRMGQLMMALTALALIGALLFPTVPAPSQPASAAPTDAVLSAFAMFDLNDELDAGALALMQTAPEIAPPAPDAGARHPRRGPDGGETRPERGRNGHWVGRGPQMSDELIKRSLEVAREVDPDLAQRLSDLRRQDPQEFERVMHEIGRRLLAMAQLKQRDPDLYRMKLSEMSQAVQIDKVARQLRAAYAEGSEGQIDNLTEQLRTLMNVQLAMELKSKAEYLCRLERQIELLYDEIDRQVRSFPAAVEARVQAKIKQARENGEKDALIPAAPPEATAPSTANP